MSRSQEEILARIEVADQDDWAGFRREVLVPALDWDHAQPFLKPEATEDGWATRTIPDAAKARDYLEFAIGKILDHRGISASRSVDKLTEFAWLLGRDDVVAAMDQADYPQYGAPKVKVFAESMGWPWPDNPQLARMAVGLPCMSYCDYGCGT